MQPGGVRAAKEVLDYVAVGRAGFGGRVEGVGEGFRWYYLYLSSQDLELYWTKRKRGQGVGKEGKKRTINPPQQPVDQEVKVIHAQVGQVRVIDEVRPYRPEHHARGIADELAVAVAVEKPWVELFATG